MKKITRRSFMAAAGLTVAALALTACGGSSSTASSAAASSVASSAAASSEAASAAATELTTVEAGKLTMATNAAFPPYEMTTDAGEFEGIDIETAQAIADKLGLELQIDDMDFDAALLSVQQGKADIVMAGVTVIWLARRSALSAAPPATSTALMTSATRTLWLTTTV